MHHLLAEEYDTQEDNGSSGSDSPRLFKKGDEETLNSADVSTDTSLVQDSAYAIN